YAVAASLSELELKKILMDKMEANKSIERADTQRTLYNALVASYNSEKDIISSYEDVVLLKIGHDDKEKDQDPSARSDRGMKMQRTEEPSHNVEDISKHQDQDQATRTEEPLASFDEFNATTFDFSAFVLNTLQIPNLTQELLVGPAFNLLKGTCKSLTELEYHLEECSKATAEKLDWNNPENKPYPFNLRKPLPLIQDRPKCQSFYCYASNLTSSKDVYSRRRIITFTRLKIKRKYDYGYLEEIEVRRDDQQIYTFKEGDFSKLRLQDIKYMLLLLTQRRLSNLIVDEWYDLNVALRIKDGISVDEEMKSVRQEEGSGYGLEYRQAAILKEVNAQSGEVFWWQTVWGRPSATRKDHMIYHMLFSSFSQNQRDLPRDIPLDSVEVLRYDKRIKSEIKGKMPTEMELVLEQTQQGNLKIEVKVPDSSCLKNS
nr:hypothetical protein [Tanacetum cinerariifolium]